MVWDAFTRQWTIDLELEYGEYSYKFYQDGNWIYNEEDTKTTDL